MKIKFKVNTAVFETTQECLTREEILTQAGKTPVNQFDLIQKLHGNEEKKIGPGEKVDLSPQGIEKFVAIPLSTQEGSGLRRDFVPPEKELPDIEESGYVWEAVKEANQHYLIFRNVPVPEGFNVKEVDIAIFIPPSYPVAKLDMAFFSPHLNRTNGRTINRTTNATILGKTWQRWSRHLTNNSFWNGNVDGIMSHLAYVKSWLENEIQKAA